MNIKIYIKTAPTCFGSITIIRSGLFELAKVIAMVMMVIEPKYVGAVLM
jgi:hypothetical protein